MTVTNQNQDQNSYDEFAMNKLEEWLMDVIENTEITSEEIYSMMSKSIHDRIEYHQSKVNKLNKLVSLMQNKIEGKKSWTVPVECESEDCVISFPDELIQITEWKEGDVLEWIDNGDGSWTLKKTN